jgi:hypothetical protein
MVEWLKQDLKLEEEMRQKEKASAKKEKPKASVKKK